MLALVIFSLAVCAIAATPAVVDFEHESLLAREACTSPYTQEKGNASVAACLVKSSLLIDLASKGGS